MVDMEAQTRSQGFVVSPPWLILSLPSSKEQKRIPSINPQQICHGRKMPAGGCQYFSLTHVGSQLTGDVRGMGEISNGL